MQNAKWDIKSFRNKWLDLDDYNKIVSIDVKWDSSSYRTAGEESIPSLD